MIEYSQLRVGAAPPLLPASVAVLFSRRADAVSLRTAAHAELGPSAAGTATDLLALAAQALWQAAIPGTALCQPAAGTGSGGGGGSNEPRHEQQHFHEEAPALPAGTLHHLRTGRLAAALAAYRPFAAGYVHAHNGDYAGASVDVTDPDGGGDGGGREGFVSGIVSRGRARVKAQRAAAAGRWIRMRRLLNRVLGTNEFFSGGLLLMVTGLAAAVAREAWRHGLEWAKRRLLVRCELENRDDAYRWVMAWLARHPDFAASNAFSVSSSLAGFGNPMRPAGVSPWGNASNSAGQPQLMCLPAPGMHGLRFRGRRIWFERTQYQNANEMRPVEELEIVTFAMRGGRDAIMQLLAQAHEDYQRMQSERTSIFATDQESYFWEQVGSRPVRPLASVVLPAAQAEAVLADCRRFEASEEWYAQHGIPYRRGFLLHGPPGTGKTSLVTALAGALGRPIYVISLSSKGMSDESLRALLNSAAPRCMLLLEDVDAAFLERKADDAKGVTFSGLLNAIDGVAAQEGRLLFMTTNHPERLAPALVRPGRVDVRLAFANATSEQAQAFFASFYQDVELAEALGIPAALLQSSGFAAEAAAAAQRFQADSAAASAAAGDLPRQLAVRAAELAAQQLPASSHQTPAAAPDEAAPGASAAGVLDSTAPQVSAEAEPAAAGSTDGVPPASQQPGAIEITGMRMIGGAGDSAAAAALATDAATAVAAFQFAGADAAAGQVAATAPMAVGDGGGVADRTAMEAAAAAEQAVCAAVMAALAGEFVQRVPGGTASIARLQGHLMSYRQEPAAAVATASALLQTAHEDPGSSGGAGRNGDGSAPAAAAAGDNPAAAAQP